MPLISVAGNNVTVSGGFWARETDGTHVHIKLHGRSSYPALTTSSFSVHRAGDGAALAVSSVTRSGDTVTITHADAGNGDVYVVPGSAAQTHYGFPARFYLPWNGSAGTNGADHDAIVAAPNGGHNRNPYFTGQNTIRDLPSGDWLMFAATWEDLARTAPTKFSEPIDRTCVFASGTRLYLDGLFADDGWTVEMSVPNSGSASALHTGPSLVWVSGRNRLGEHVGGVRLAVIIPDGRFPSSIGFRGSPYPLVINGSSELHWHGVELQFIDENDADATQNLYGISMTNADSDVDFTIRSVPRKPGDTSFLVMRVRFGAMTRGDGRLDVTLIDTFIIIEDIAANAFEPSSIKQVEGSNRGGSGHGAGLNALTPQPSERSRYHTVRNYAPVVPAGAQINFAGGNGRVPLSLLNPTLDPERMIGTGLVRVVVDVTVHAIDALGAAVAGIPFTITNDVDARQVRDMGPQDYRPYPAWVSGGVYVAGNVVFHNPFTYEAIRDTFGSTSPLADTTNWRRVSAPAYLEWDAVSHYAAGVILHHGGRTWRANRANSNVEPTAANSADWGPLAAPDTSAVARTSARGEAVIRRTIYSMAASRLVSDAYVQVYPNDGRAATLRMRDVAYDFVERAVTLAAGENVITVQVARDADAPATVPATSQGRVAFDVARKVVSPPDYSMSPRTLYGLLKRDLPATLAPFFTMSGNTLTLDADWDVTFSSPTTLGLQAGPEGDDSNRLALQGTGTYSGTTGDGIYVDDSTGVTVRITTQPGAKIIHGTESSRTRHYVPQGAVLRAYDEASARQAADDVTVPNIAAGETITGLSFMPEHHAFLVGIHHASAPRLAIVTEAGRLLGTSPVTGVDGIRSVCHVRAGLAAILTGNLESVRQVHLFDPSPILSSSAISLLPSPLGLPSATAMAWNGQRMVIAVRQGLQALLRLYALNSSGTGLVHTGVDRPVQFSLFHSGGTSVDGMAVIGGRLYVLASGGGLGIGTFTTPTSLHPTLQFRNINRPNSTAYAGVRHGTVSAGSVVTVPSGGTAGVRVPPAERSTDRRVTVKAEGYDYETRVINPLVPDHAIALSLNRDIDTSIDISDYDLTSSGGSARNVYAAPTADGTGSRVYFSDTYDLKASPEKSKRLLDAVLTTDDGLRLLHRYSANPSPNNGGRVASFHPTYVNILPGWITLARKAGLPTEARAVFGIAAYIGDDTTYYRSQELNGGHVEVADPTVYVQFDAPRIRAVSREIIEDADNQQAIADAVLEAEPASDDTAGSVSRILYALRNGPGSGGGGSLTQDQSDAILRLTQDRADKIDEITATRMGYLDASIAAIPTSTPVIPTASAIADAVHERLPDASDPANSLGQRIRSMDTEIGNLHTRLSSTRAGYLDALAVRPMRVSDIPASVTVSPASVESVRAAILNQRLSGFTLGATPTTVGEVIAFLSRVRYVREGTTSPPVYNVSANVGTVTLPNNISVGEVSVSETSRQAIADEVLSRDTPSDAANTSLGKRVESINTEVGKIPLIQPSLPGSQEYSLRVDERDFNGKLANALNDGTTKARLGAAVLQYSPRAQGPGWPEESAGRLLADAAAKAKRLKFNLTGTAEAPVEAELKEMHDDVPTGLTVPSADEIAAAVLRRVPDADTEPANPTGSLQRLLQTSVGQATLARQALVNNVVRDEDASTLALRNDANDGDLIVWDLRNADGTAAGTGTAYERRRRP